MSPLSLLSLPPRRLAPGAAFALGLILAATAGGCLDMVGHEEDVTNQSGVQSTSQLTDDQIGDKHPLFDPTRTVTDVLPQQWVPLGGCPIEMNKSAAVTRLDILPFTGDGATLEGRLFHGRADALAAIVAADPTADPIPSMEVVNGYLKPFDDGLYAAVELAEEADKRALLNDLLARVTDPAATTDTAIRATFDDAAVMLAAASILDGQTPPVASSIIARAQSRADAFRAQPIFARPIGFYDWTPDLQAIFTRDRFLQNGDETESFGGLATLAFVLGGDAALLARYQRVSGLYAGLTNPFAAYSIDALIPYVSSVGALADVTSLQAVFDASNRSRHPCDGTVVAFLPASRSKEGDFFDAASCAGTLGGDTNLLDALVAAIRAGTVDLEPDASSGWYDYQIYALETLLLPERAPEDLNLLLTAGYKKKLVQTFKSILIETRETHVKQLEGSAASSAPLLPVDAYPLFPTEPFPTFYLRLARGYRFLRTFLQAAEGQTFLSATNRLLEGGGRAPASLANELDQRISLLYGLTFLGANAVGMAQGQGLLADELAEIDQDAAIEAARSWLAGWKADADVTADSRVIVPLLRNGASVHYAVVVGVNVLRAHVEYVAGHEPMATPTGCWTGAFVPHDYPLLVDASVEVTLPASKAPPTRDELRAICDGAATTDDIVHALESP